MNILLAFKAEPDAGMLAEKEWQAAAQGKSGPDISLLRSLLGADEQAAAALLLAQRKNGTPMSLNANRMFIRTSYISRRHQREGFSFWCP